jgi:hypothetical protein
VLKRKVKSANKFSLFSLFLCVQASNLKVWAGSGEDDSECRQPICGTKWMELLSLPRKVTKPLRKDFRLYCRHNIFYVLWQYTDKASAVDLNHVDADPDLVVLTQLKRYFTEI